MSWTVRIRAARIWAASWTERRAGRRAGALVGSKREVPSDFDIVAATYDTLVRRNPGYVDHLRMSADRLGLFDEGRGLRVLDLCCGTGLSTEALAAAYPKSSIVGLDASAGMLDLARVKSSLSGTCFVLGDAMDPAPAIAAALGVPEADVRFDAVLMAYGIRNMSDPDECLMRMRSLLAPGAPICFHEYSVADSPRARGTWTAVAWGIIIPSGLVTSRHMRIYRYLWRSVLRFDGVVAFEGRLRRAGFSNVHTEPMSGWQRGIVHSFLARAPISA